jgi:hypothetical protein
MQIFLIYTLIQWVLGALAPGVKQMGRETNHSPPSCVGVKNVWSYATTYPMHLLGINQINHIN